MRIYLLGYFGLGAFADDLIEHLTKRIFLEAARAKKLVFMDSQTFPHPRKGREVADFFNENADVVVFCGGSLLGRLRLSPFDCIPEWIGYLNTPLIILGTGWRQEREPLTKEECRRMQMLCDRADHIHVRGEISRDAVNAQINPNRNVQVLGDPGLCFPYSPIKAFASETRRVGVVVRQIPDAELAQDPTTLNNDTFHAQLAELLDWIAEKEKSQIVFFPMASQDRRQDNDWQAVAAVRLLMNTGDQAIIYDELFSRKFHSAALVGEMLGQMNFVISQRLHGTLVSIAQGVPVMPIEYQFSKMADSLSIPGFERLRELITPMRHVCKESYQGKLPELMDEDLRQENLIACKGLRERYHNLVTDTLRTICPMPDFFEQPQAV